MFRFENAASQKDFRFVVGIDEAGRGPLAGPVVASAVILKKRRFKSKICDSKKINAAQREAAFHEILENAFVGTGVISEQVIDLVNILRATYLAMNLAVHRLVKTLPPEETAQQNFEKNICLLIDGNSFKSDLPYSYQTIVDGDQHCKSISAASIVAKVTRDRILKVYDQVYPQYGFRFHKGYGTRIHRAAIKVHGLSLIHRKTFSMDACYGEE